MKKNNIKKSLLTLLAAIALVSTVSLPVSAASFGYASSYTTSISLSQAYTITSFGGGYGGTAAVLYTSYYNNISDGKSGTSNSVYRISSNSAGGANATANAVAKSGYTIYAAKSEHTGTEVKASTGSTAKFSVTRKL